MFTYILTLTTLTFTHALVVDNILPPNPNVIAHAVAEFGPQVLGDPTYPASYPSVEAALVGKDKDNNPLDGCGDGTKLVHPLPEPFFVLATRGNCDFATKALNAQQLGAAGIIIYNDVQDSEELVVMHEEDGIDILIPSIFIITDAGTDLMQMMPNEPNVNKEYIFVTINATGCELNCGPWDNQWQISVLWFLFIAFLSMWVVVLVCFSTALCKRWCHRSARQRAVGKLRRRKYKKVAVPSSSSENAGDSKSNDPDDENNDATNQSPASPAQECALRQQTVDPESRFEQDSCVICLCEFENGDNLMVLPCQHEFHTECINPWLLKKSSKCPICKTSCMPKPVVSETARTPLLEDGQNDETYDPEIGTANSINSGSGNDSDEDPDDVDSDDDSDDERTDFLNTRIFGMHPGALVLAGACCTGVGIAVAIMIFLLDG